MFDYLNTDNHTDYLQKLCGTFLMGCYTKGLNLTGEGRKKAAELRRNYIETTNLAPLQLRTKSFSSNFSFKEIERELENCINSAFVETEDQ